MGLQYVTKSFCEVIREVTTCVHFVKLLALSASVCNQ